MIYPHKCPTCGAKEGECCRTPSGRKRKAIHNDRPFSIVMQSKNK